MEARRLHCTALRPTANHRYSLNLSETVPRNRARNGGVLYAEMAKIQMAPGLEGSRRLRVAGSTSDLLRSQQQEAARGARRHRWRQGTSRARGVACPAGSSYRDVRGSRVLVWSTWVQKTRQKQKDPTAGAGGALYRGFAVDLWVFYPVVRFRLTQR